jgi:hypothetical protein
MMSTLREELDAKEREGEEPSIFGMLEGTSLANQKRAWWALPAMAADQAAERRAKAEKPPTPRPA